MQTLGPTNESFSPPTSNASRPSERSAKEQGSRRQSALRQAWTRLKEPISEHKRALLEQRWQELPPSLRTDRQTVGQHFTHCGYTMGAAYCSFGCTHCYLPRNANQAPLPTLADMKEQIDANYQLLGDFGALQITGGDVLDAYWKADKGDELIEIIRYATDTGLVPMLMTHGQVLLENPGYFERLVTEGGLVKVAIHIDMTQAGRKGFPIKSIRSEADLHPLRQQFVELVEGVARRTGRPISAAHTVTVTERNIESIGEIVNWLSADARRLKVFRMLSLQPEADVGRTRYSSTPVTPETVWQQVSDALEVDLARDSVQFGHPDCSSISTVLVDSSRGTKINLMPATEESNRLMAEVIRVFGGVGSRGESHLVANAQRLGLLARNPMFLATGLRYLVSLRKGRTGVSLSRTVLNALRGNAATLNVVMHNFMSASEVEEPRSQTVEDRLAGCSFRGAIKQEGQWVAVPMCSMNSEEREKIYDDQIVRARNEELVALRPAS